MCVVDKKCPMTIHTLQLIFFTVALQSSCHAANGNVVNVQYIYFIELSVLCYNPDRHIYALNCGDATHPSS